MADKLEWLITKHGIIPSKELCELAITENSVECLFLMLGKKNCYTLDQIIKLAIKEQKVSILRFLFAEKLLKPTIELALDCVEKDNESLYKLLRIVNCPWDNTLCKKEIWGPKIKRDIAKFGCLCGKIHIY